ncbi:hypothetical protein EDD21DRAFT_416653 [Dissophora ornata]|nr:hypothetical protein EDD21DRAFT_416653 [Dissophora ornata]
MQRTTRVPENVLMKIVVVAEVVVAHSAHAADTSKAAASTEALLPTPPSSPRLMPSSSSAPDSPVLHAEHDFRSMRDSEDEDMPLFPETTQH